MADKTKADKSAGEDEKAKDTPATPQPQRFETSDGTPVEPSTIPEKYPSGEPDPSKMPGGVHAVDPKTE